MNKTLKLGLKLWSVNVNLIPFAQKFYEQGHCDYIELYTVPGTFAQTVSQWEKFAGPYIIHAPHNAHNFNLAKRELVEENQRKFTEVLEFTKRLKAQWIIVHGGNSGPIEETIEQLKKFADPRILVENKPMKGHRDQLLVGFSAEDIDRICRQAHLSGVVFDFSHAVCAANSLNKDPLVWIKSFLDLPIKIFHLGDGDWNSHVDMHSHFGEGTFPIKDFIKCIPPGALVSVETRMDSKNKLQDYKADLVYLRNLTSE
jgi:sugar phosphate isomerase/epimerase